MAEKKLNIRDFNWEGKIILIVEDDYPSYVYLNTLIGFTKAQTVHIQNGLEAVEYCRKEKIDLILMDIQLPGISGFEATIQIKKILPHVPIIAQTAFALKGEKEKSIESGCDAYITKPIDKNLLIEIINRYLNK